MTATKKAKKRKKYLLQWTVEEIDIFLKKLNR